MTLLRRAFSVLVVLLLSACAGMPSAPPPKLLVFIAIDGLPQWQVTAYRDQLAPDGFARFLDRGAWFADAHHGHAFTVTAAGHATMLTGAYPRRTGIVGNDWLDPATGARVYNTGDASHHYLDNPTDPLDGTSPRNLRVETLGDVLRRAHPSSRVVAVSGKDRGAILLAGHAGTAYMYMDDSGKIVTSDYYAKALPAWVNDFNAARPADRFFTTEWKPLLPEAAYARSLPDKQPWFSRSRGALPMRIAEPGVTAPDKAYYQRLLASPFIDALVLDFARSAIAGEQLGRHEAPDILALSQSGHDYVNHAFSAESRLSHDHFLQLDRLLQAFFQDLDQRVGAGNYLVALTADHGFTPAPEYSASLGRDAKRISGDGLVRNINDALQQRFGPGRWVRGFSAGGLLIDSAAADRVPRETLAEAARDALRAHPAVAVAYTRRELMSGSGAGGPHFEALARSFHPEVSPDVPYVLNPWWIATTAGATHGSPYAYDTHVPILLWGPPWVRAGRVDRPVAVVDLAPTLARVLVVPAPAAAEGRPLPLSAP
jgi:predicted AlkP superfamily pyrophosphatase or phosphodiesterase